MVNNTFYENIKNTLTTHSTLFSMRCLCKGSFPRTHCISNIFIIPRSSYVRPLRTMLIFIIIFFLYCSINSISIFVITIDFISKNLRCKNKKAQEYAKEFYHAITPSLTNCSLILFFVSNSWLSSDDILFKSITAGVNTPKANIQAPMLVMIEPLFSFFT